MIQSSSLVFRRFWCSLASLSSLSPRKKLVFMGSPQVSAFILDALLKASTATDSLFERLLLSHLLGETGRGVIPSPVAQHEQGQGFPSVLIFTPECSGESSLMKKPQSYIRSNMAIGGKIRK